MYKRQAYGTQDWHYNEKGEILHFPVDNYYYAVSYTHLMCIRDRWYANQIKYHKVTGEEPGKELKSWSYSVKEVADLLGVDEYLVYDLLKKNQMEAVIVDYWKRIPKESFQNWYKSQSRYRTKEDRKKDALLEDATITMPEMAQLLGTTRSAVYTTVSYTHLPLFLSVSPVSLSLPHIFRQPISEITNIPFRL